MNQDGAGRTVTNSIDDPSYIFLYPLHGRLRRVVPSKAGEHVDLETPSWTGGR